MNRLFFFKKEIDTWGAEFNQTKKKIQALDVFPLERDLIFSEVPEDGLASLLEEFLDQALTLRQG